MTWLILIVVVAGVVVWCLFNGSGVIVERLPEGRTGQAPQPTAKGAPRQVGTPPPAVINRVDEIPWEQWHNPPAGVIKLESIKIAGVTHNNADGTSRQEILSRMKQWETIDLVREPANEYDKNAVALFGGMGQVGYVPTQRAVQIAAMLDHGAKALAKLSGLYGGAGEKSWGASVDIHIQPQEGAQAMMVNVVGITGKDEEGNPRKENAERVNVGDTVDLYADTDDNGDPFVGVYIDSMDIGRLGKADAKKIWPLIDSGQAVAAEVVNDGSEDDEKLTLRVVIL